MATLSPEQAEWVERNVAQVRIVARTVRRMLPEIALDELESAGNEGLVQAALRYDPESGVTFASFAHYRIRGAMLDWVRRQNPGMRRHQRALKSLEASQSLLEDAARKRSDRRSALEAKVAAARRLVEKTATSVMTSRAMDNDPERVAIDESPEAAVIDRETLGRLRGAVETLPADDRALIDAIYQKGESMAELAARLGVAKSTVSRRHTKLMGVLAKRLAS
jgi:RNA polymerase sigma factor for flagellar operon FliA